MNAQGTDAWHGERLGLPTASMYSAVLAKGEGKTRKAYMIKLAAERLTGKRTESFSNGHTDRGTEQEPYARLSYESLTGNAVQEVGFIRHPALMTGSSPDGLIDLDGGVEIKSVIPTVQIETILKGGYPSGHRAQIQGNLWITGREWWDFISYSPDMPQGLDTYIFRVVRDEAYIKELEAEVIHFLADLDAMVAQLAPNKPKEVNMDTNENTEAERKAGEARAAAAIEAERIAEARRVADIAEFNDNQIAAHQEAEAKRVAEGARNALKDAILGDVLAASDMGQSLDGLAGKSVRGPTQEGKRAILVDAGDDVRDFLKTQTLTDKEHSWLRARLMAFEQFRAERAMAAAA